MRIHLVCRSDTYFLIFTKHLKVVAGTSLKPKVSWVVRTPSLVCYRLLADFELAHLFPMHPFSAP